MADRWTWWGEEHVVWTGAVRGAVWAEGPHLYRHDGHIYLLASEGGTSFHHAVSVARAERPSGPFTGYAGNPVFSHRHFGHDYPVVNVGHADLVEGADGQWWSVVLASRPIDGVDLLGRETYLVPVEWQKGWPVFAPGVGRLTANPAEARGYVRDRRSDDELLAVRCHPGDIARVEEDTIWLQAGAGLSAAHPHYVCRRLRQPRTTVGVTLEDVQRGASAGLALRYDSQVWASLTAEPTESGTRICLVVSDETGCRQVGGTEVDAGAVGRLEFAVDGLTATATWAATGGSGVTKGTVGLDRMGAAVSGGFVGVTYGVLAEGNGVVRVSDLS